jgi:hypothetical protein
MRLLRSLWRHRPKFLRGRGIQPGQDDETYFVLFVFIGVALLFAVLVAL